MTQRVRSFTDMMVQVLLSKRVGNYEVQAAAAVIAADARGNIWFVENIKRKPDTTELALQYLDCGENLLAECARAVDTFLDGGPNETLRSDLWAIERKLNELSK